MNNKQCIIIGVAGGTGSGKTTFTDRLKNEFGNNITVLHHDNYYKSQSNLSTEERKNANYDHPNQLETKLLIEHLQQLRMGKSIECPIYDFTQLQTATFRGQQGRISRPVKAILSGRL